MISINRDSPHCPHAAFSANSTSLVFPIVYPSSGLILSSEGVFHPLFALMSNGMPVASQTPLSSFASTHSGVRSNGSPFARDRAFAPPTSLLAREVDESRRDRCHSRATAFRHCLQTFRNAPPDPVRENADGGPSCPQCKQSIIPWLSDC